MEFANKEYLLLLLLLIPYVLWYFLYRKNRLPSLRMSTTKAYRYGPRSACGSPPCRCCCAA